MSIDILLWASPLLVWRIVGLYYYLGFNESFFYHVRYISIFAILSVTWSMFFCRTENFMKEIQILMIIGTRKIMFICYLILWIYLTIWTYPKGEKWKLHSTKFLDVRALIGKTMVVIKNTTQQSFDKSTELSAKNKNYICDWFFLDRKSVV